MQIRKQLTVIGRAEYVQFLGSPVQTVPAKVDTGADISSVWASEIVEEDGSLRFVLFAKNSPFYTGQQIVLHKPDYRLTRVANSFGQRELRFVVKLRVRLANRTFRASFTLADRSAKIYPVLIGRRLLNKKFLVDVASGTPLLEAEKRKRRAMRVAFGINEE